ncbi:hypothetical protein ALC62_05167 [Cyphomyrmex costatus]|uniref:Uncharacterized protein n=1 Tax=Cyphomyrmex costatus TaxID=456900 RepID=A0A151IKC1_9HYME|nr:hypothetical protein ALC62_05167 [Cyphomyrmex costatus]
MIIPTFVDLQGFVLDKKFIVKVVAVLRRGTVITHYIFSCPMPWNLLNGMVPYSMAKRLITEAVTEDDEALVYVKGLEKRQWLVDILDCDNAIVETLDAHYEDVESLRNIDSCNTIRCGRYAKNCALQNVFKIFNWWSQHQE